MGIGQINDFDHYFRDKIDCSVRIWLRVGRSGLEWIVTDSILFFGP